MAKVVTKAMPAAVARRGSTVAPVEAQKLTNKKGN